MPPIGDEVVSILLTVRLETSQNVCRALTRGATYRGSLPKVRHWETILTTSMLTTAFRYINEGRQLCSALKHADTEVAERLVRLENNWIRFASQLNFYQRIQHIMDDEHRDVHDQTLQILQNKLEIVLSLLKRLVTPSREKDEVFPSPPCHKIGRWKYAGRKSSLDEAIANLEVWQGLSDQSWFLLLRIADSQVDKALAMRDDNTVSGTDMSLPATAAIRAGLQQLEHVALTTASPGHYTLSSSALNNMVIEELPYCDSIAVALRTYSDGTTKRYILNRIEFGPGAKTQILKRNIRDLVRKLQVDEPQIFGLLKCKGFIAEPTPTGTLSQLSLTLVFRDPCVSQSPRSLRNLLINMPVTTSITQRLQLARDLAKSVGYVHIFGFVHKNVRPESILLFNRSAEPGFCTFLVGFENLRRDEGWTQRRGDDAVDKNLYRHPSRQGFNPRDDYEMRHDVYSTLR